jgi:hypothetical protein
MINSADGPGILRTHQDFRLIALANRPGFPFLGNDFFASLVGVCFVRAQNIPKTNQSYCRVMCLLAMQSTTRV